MGRFHPWAVPDPEPDSDPYLLHCVATGTGVTTGSTSGSGPPLVLIHGVAGSQMVWDRIVPLLEPHFTIVRMDLLGYGHSPKPRVRHTPLRHVTAIRRTLAHEGVTGPIVLVGLSMGSNLMLEYALRWPDEVRAMIGIGFPFYPTEAAARIGLRHNLWTRLALQVPLLASIIVPLVWWAGRLAPGVLSRNATIYTGEMAKDALRARYQSFRSSLLHCMVNYRLQEPLRASGSTRRLFIHGSDDQWASVEAVRQALHPYPLSELHVIEDAPHNLAVAEPARTAALILDHMGWQADPA
jgi:pimeloyl-ACP methyl ester carboxylesterase